MEDKFSKAVFAFVTTALTFVFTLYVVTVFHTLHLQGAF
jgi:hypothetical protein